MRYKLISNLSEWDLDKDLVLVEITTDGMAYLRQPHMRGRDKRAPVRQVLALAESLVRTNIHRGLVVLLQEGVKWNPIWGDLQIF